MWDFKLLPTKVWLFFHILDKSCAIKRLFGLRALNWVANKKINTLVTCKFNKIGGIKNNKLCFIFILTRSNLKVANKYKSRTLEYKMNENIMKHWRLDPINKRRHLKSYSKSMYNVHILRVKKRKKKNHESYFYVDLSFAAIATGH